MISFDAEKGFTLKEMEEQAIRYMLNVFDGNRIATAKALGIGRSTLYRKLWEYGIESKGAKGARKKK